jgi:glucose/arabinose dehydrogenase
MRPISPIALSASALLLAGLLATPAAAQTPLTTTRVTGGLLRPVWIGSPPGDSRLFVIEQRRGIRIIEDGLLLPTFFLNLQGSLAGASEQGFLGMAFDPNYRDNGIFYTSHNNTAGTSVISRWQVSADPNVADASSQTVILTQSQPATNHNGGNIAFGPDGMLYVGFGDGGGAGDTPCNAQNLGTLLGKMLRIDVTGAATYSIPADNPFVGMGGARGEIWHYGLRNPWRWSFDRETGELYLGDVGQNAWEEISYAPAGTGGLNFGWKIMEGNHCFSTSGCTAPPPCNDPSLTDAILELSQTSGPHSITGGIVYRGCAIPDLHGTYIFADYIDDRIRSFTYSPMTGVTNFMDRTAELAPGGGFSILSPSSFGEDADGELYIADLSGGEIFKIVPASAPIGLVDCDGNGLDDVCEIASFPERDLDQNGTPDACQGLSADVASVSASAGGHQNLFLHAPPAQAGHGYLVAGSVTGNSPGFSVGGFNVPLNFDSYTFRTIVLANVPPLLNTLGILDGNAEAEAAFDLDGVPVPPGVIGLTISHAYATLFGGAFTFASNHVQVLVTP